MAANTTIAEETRRRLEALAGSGQSADALADKVLSDYLERQELARDLDDLTTWGQKHARRMGYKPGDVERAIAESRAERRR
jgi:hypothetical protein